MDREDIIRMAREQGLPETASEGVFIVNSDDLGRMLAAEREACETIADAEASSWGGFDSGFTASVNIAAAIRARGNK